MTGDMLWERTLAAPELTVTAGNRVLSVGSSNYGIKP